MKRFICLLVLTVVSASAGMCAISSRDMTNSVYLENQGYSSETIRIVNDQMFKPKSPKLDENRWSSFWQRLYAYIDPAHEDGMFGRHEIRFKNCWDDI